MPSDPRVEVVFVFVNSRLGQTKRQACVRPYGLHRLAECPRGPYEITLSRFFRWWSQDTKSSPEVPQTGRWQHPNQSVSQFNAFPSVTFLSSEVGLSGPGRSVASLDLGEACLGEPAPGRLVPVEGHQQGVTVQAAAPAGAGHLPRKCVSKLPAQLFRLYPCCVN